MANQPRNFIRGLLPDQIEFDPGRPHNTSGGNGDIFHGKFHRKLTSDGSRSQYSDVALKRMRCGTTDENNRFGDILKEACVWMGFDHPNLLRFMGILFEGQDLYLVSPFASSGSVLRYLRVYPDQNRPKILWQIAAGITHLHGLGIVHGDVKAANVLIFNGLVAKICDFGLSKHLDGRQTTSPQYSLAWTSPERWNGEPRSYASDVYAFGMTIYEILSDNAPFSTLSRDDFNQRVYINGERPPMDPASSPGGIPYALLWELAKRCWQKAPSQRFTMEQARDFIARMEVVEGEFTASNSDDLPVHTLTMPPASLDTATVTRKRFDSTGSSPTDRPKKRLMLQSDQGAEADVHSTNVGFTTGFSQDDFHRVNSLPRARTASHNAAKDAQSRCLAGTRTVVLKKIYDWVEGIDSTTPHVFWLNGMAGTGKSTIAKTLAERAENEGVLGASFFFDRHGQPEVRNGELVIPTIAFQLAQSVPSFKHHLAAALAKDLDVLSFTRESQLQKLIVQPLQAVTLSKPLIVIFDALDECETKQAKELLQLLLSMMSESRIHSNSPALRLFIACRPTRDLDITFRTAQSHHELLLHDVEQDIIQSDIELYLRDGLTNPPPHPSLPSDWISATDLEVLSHRSGKLFVYATTIIKYIRDNEFDSSRDRLDSLLRTGHGNAAEEEHALADLDDLYLQVLRTAITSKSTRNSEAIAKRSADRIRSILGALVVLRSHLPTRALGKLIGVLPDQMRTTLEHLQSVVVTPKTIEDHPQFLHQSFPDFIIDPNRCSDGRFLVDIEDHERRVTAHCLTIMIASLKRNILEEGDATDAGLTDTMHPAEPGSEPEGGVTVAEEKRHPAIEPELAYACCNWASHLAKSPDGEPQLVEHLSQFTGRCLLWWLEVLGRIGHAAEAVRAADDACKWAVRSKVSESTISLLRDIHRFVLANLHPISEDYRHIYFSALPFTPRNTLLWKKYQHEAESSIQISSGVEEDWPLCLAVLPGPPGLKGGLSFSPDGSRIASGHEDGTVQVWDVFCGQRISILNGHKKSVQATTYSPCGTYIASASDDLTIHIWNALSGQCIRVLIGHDSTVCAVTFSPHGIHVASGSGDGTVRIWNAISGKHIRTLEGHTGSVDTVAFSPDGSKLVSGSGDGTARIWDAASGRQMSTVNMPDKNGVIQTDVFTCGGIHGAWVALLSQKRSTAAVKDMNGQLQAAVFSFDGTCIVTGSSGEDHVQEWDAATGRHIATLAKSDTAGNGKVAFSLDGALAAHQPKMGSTVYIQDIASQRTIAILRDHSTDIWGLAFSPDGSIVAAGARDGTIRIWNVPCTQQSRSAEGHDTEVKMIAISPDCKRIISQDQTGTICLWDAISGQYIRTLGDGNYFLDSIKISPDGSLIVTRCSDLTREILDANSGQEITILDGGQNFPTSATFSPDSNQVASASYCGAVRIWNARSGKDFFTFFTEDVGPHGCSYCFAKRSAWDIGWMTHITFSAQGDYIASGSDNGDIRIWSTASGMQVTTLSGQVRSSKTTVIFSSDAALLASGTDDGTVRMWDVVSGGLISSLNDGRGPVASITFEPGRNCIRIWSTGAILRIWDPTSNSSTLQAPSLAALPASDFLPSDPDEKHIVPFIQAWSQALGIPAFKPYGLGIRSMAFSLDKRTVVIGRGTGGICIFKAPSTCS